MKISLSEKAELKKLLDAMSRIEVVLARHTDDPEAARLLSLFAGGSETASTESVYLAGGEEAVPQRDLGADERSVQQDQEARKIMFAAKSKGETVDYLEALRRVELGKGGSR